MAAPQYSNPFPPLQLSLHDAQQLEELALAMVAQLMGDYEAYLTEQRRSVDAARYKFLKQREGVRVYRERSTLRQRRPSSARADADPGRASAFSVTSEDMNDGGLAPESDIPVLLTVGTIAGSLYDAMYGVTNPTLEQMRLKTAYIQDGIINAAVLAKLREPSVEDPFHSLTVKWAIKGQPLHVRTVVKNRDLVYLEATGLSSLPSSGEIVGYQLLHTVEFPQTHRLDGSTRGNISICGLYRQLKDGVVDMYGRGFVDPTGRLVRALVVKSATEAMLSSWRTMHTAQLKKLAYAMRRRHVQGSLLSNRTDLRRRRAQSLGGSHKACGICCKTLSSLASLSFGKMSHPSQCRLCGGVVCTSCRVKKKLASIAPDDWLYELEIPFCLLCVTAVTNVNAFDIAVDELVHKDAQRGYGGASVSSSMSSTERHSFDGSYTGSAYML